MFWKLSHGHPLSLRKTQPSPTINFEEAIIEQMEKLKAQGRICRVGPDKGGHWEVVNKESRDFHQ